MVAILKSYRCEVCGSEWSEEADAAACEAQPPIPRGYEVGQFVGAGVHGWWKADQTWALTMPQLPGERHQPPGHREWREERTGQAEPPGRFWFLPIWRVVAVVPCAHAYGDPGHRHCLGYVLWSPRHANVVGGSGHRLVKTYSSGHRGAVVLDLSQYPVLTTSEQNAFAKLVDRFREGGEKAMRDVGLL